MDGMFDALRRILVTEGWDGLSKSIVPSVIKAAPAVQSHLLLTDTSE